MQIHTTTKKSNHRSASSGLASQRYASADASRRPYIIVPPHSPVGERERYPLVVMARPISHPVITPHHVYFDDSGYSDKTKGRFIWAGYAAPMGFWEKFGNKWNAILARKPALPFWHQTDIRAKNRTSNPKNRFRGFSAEVLRNRERALCQLLEENKSLMYSFAVTLHHQLLARYVTGKIQTVPPGQPQPAAQLQAIMQAPQMIALLAALRLCEERHSDDVDKSMPISFHCEKRGNDDMQALMAYAWTQLKQHPVLGSKLGILDFPPGKSSLHPQLQAADMLAWHINRRVRDGKTPPDPHWKSVRVRRLYEHALTPKELKNHVRIWNGQKPA